MLAGAMDGNSTALASLTAAGTAWALNIYGAYDKLATKTRVGNVESVLETQFGDDLANLTSGNTSSDVSADINALKDVVNLENWGNLLGVDVVLSSPSNIGAPLTSNVIRFNDALFGTSNTSVCHALKSNVSNLQAFQSNTTNLLSNIQSELFTHDTLLALHSNELADNVITITSSFHVNTLADQSFSNNKSHITARTTVRDWWSTGGLFTNTITSQRANGQAVALYARDTNNPDRADNIEYNYVLNAPRPGTTTGGIDLFINSANRTSDGGASTATLRNANGNLRLGNASYDTILEGAVGVGTSPSYNLDIYSNHPSDPTFLRLVGNSSDRAGIILGENTSSGPQCILEYDGVGGGTNNRFQIYSEESGWKGKTGGFTYIPESGRVGLGSDNPGGMLHICSGTSGDCHLILQSDTDNNNELDNPKIVFRQDGAINTAEIGIENSGNKLAIRGTSGIAFYDGGISSTDIDNIENTSTELMRINANGNVGVGQSAPAYKLDVIGDTRVVGRALIQSTTTSDGIVCTGLGGGNSYYAHRNADPGLKLQRTSVFTGEDMEYTLVLFPAPGGTPRPNAIDLGSSSNYWRRTYTQAIYRNNEYSLSDDRIKTNETLLQNATETVLKLKPQTYNKHTFEFDKFTAEEYSNASSNNAVFSAHSNCWADQTELIENTIDDREEFPYIRRRLTEQAQRETGLIAQDIWYDSPELRHIVSIPSDASPAEDKPTAGDDPQDDPDYDSAGWGTDSASVSYTQLIPLLIKSNQEMHERIVALESALEIQQQHDAQIADLTSDVEELESANDAKQRRIDDLEERIDALVARMEAVESL